MKRKPKQWITPEGYSLDLYMNILQQPHTLIAGTTGSGKSCVINGIIYNALYKAPTAARFILIDPKYTELTLYKNLPHTIAYANETEQALNILKNVVNEIKNRYQRATAQGLRKSAESDIYIIIDELSDLILSSRGIVETLGKIARIGRAANIHLIAATQCPNRKTLSAEFAANCPARFGLRCREKIESRQIIGTADAVGLPLHGQAYYLAPQLLALELVQIPMYSDDELINRVKWWEDQANPPRRGWRKR